MNIEIKVMLPKASQTEFKSFDLVGLLFVNETFIL